MNSEKIVIDTSWLDASINNLTSELRQLIWEAKENQVDRRTYLAGKALAGLATQQGYGLEGLSHDAVELADRVITELDKDKVDE